MHAGNGGGQILAPTNEDATRVRSDRGLPKIYPNLWWWLVDRPLELFFDVFDQHLESFIRVSAAENPQDIWWCVTQSYQIVSPEVAKTCLTKAKI